MRHALPPFVIAVVVVVAVIPARGQRWDDEVNAWFAAGRLATARIQLDAGLKANERDDQARLALGITHLLAGVQELAQALYRYGLRDGGSLNLLSVIGIQIPARPIPPNPDPEPIGYDDFRGLVKRWLEALERVEAALADIRDPDVKLRLRFGQIRLDLNKDGRADETETFWRIFAAVARSRIDPSAAEAFVIGLDRADVEWLRGYWRLLAGLCEAVLAYDERELFERTAHLLFARVRSPHKFFSEPPRGGRGVYSEENILDVIATIHLINFPLKEPQRMRRALEHFQAMIEHSRRMWRLVAVETDDDAEWIPSPKQKGVIPGVAFTQEMIDGWHEFLDEADALLAGRRLVPFWRGDREWGVNLHRVFTDPRDFDLVMWVQGTGATPYLEKGGTLTTPETWQRLERIFQGRFIAFALYVN